MTEINKGETTIGRLILRDRLAENRTVLANERTLLAYVRTSLALFAAGVSLIMFFYSPVVVGGGVVLLILGAYTILRGVSSFRKMKRIIRDEEQEGISQTER